MKAKDRIFELLKKFKYPAIVVGIGILLMLIPGRIATQPEGIVEQADETPVEGVEARLRQILSMVNGAGRVEVMLTEARGEQIIYQTDNDITEKNEESSTRTDTVVVTDQDRKQDGLVTQVVSPVYLGAIIVCQGGDDPQVKLAITEAVSKVTGLRTDKISVIKMK